MPNLIKYLLACLLVGNVLAGNLSAREMGTDQKERKVGLVLSGGGARGLAHVAILRYLEEHRVKIDYIAGTSAGGIIAGLYASGMSVDDIEKAMTDLDWLDVLKDDTPRPDRSMRRKEDDIVFSVKAINGFNDFKITSPPGVISGQKIKLFLDRLADPVVAITDFDNFVIPYRAIATDVVSGDEVILKEGPLSQTMRATMAVPGVFAPVRIGDKYLVDGGLTNNSPVDVVRKMGANVVILVDISTPLLKKEELTGLLSVTSQLTGFLTERNNSRSVNSLGTNDVLIRPDIDDFSSADFVKVREIIEQGYRSVTELAPDIARYSVDESRFREYRRKLARQRVSEYVIGYIEIDNQSSLSEDVIDSYLDLTTGGVFNEAALVKSISDLYGLGFFDSIDYEIIPGAQTGLRITVREKNWGPGYLNYGLSFRGGSGLVNNLFDITVGYTRTLINSRAGEWRSIVTLGSDTLLATDFYQPVDRKLNYFVRPYIHYSAQRFYAYRNERPQIEYEVRQTVAGFEIGREFRRIGVLGLFAESVNGNLLDVVGEISLADRNFRDTIYGARFTYDRIDNVYFPRQGAYVGLEYQNIDPDDGETYGLLDLSYLQAGSFGKHSLTGRLKYSTSVDNLSSPQYAYRAGGFLNMSGYAVNELSGENYAQMMGIYYYRPNVDSFIPVYLGFSLEYGALWNQIDDIGFSDLTPAGSAFVGADTPVGPLYLAVGYASGGNSALYVYFGKSLFD